MPDFRLEAPFKPTGDQPAAIDRLVDGVQRGLQHQVLLGATGTGKTFSLASAIERLQKPTLVLAHNKTLAAQLYSEFRDFFPDNAVEYFVSYFDYYQPEAYLPRSDTYIEKDSSRNDEIDKLRHAATRALFERRDTIIVASVSCIYGLGAPVDYGATVLRLRTGGRYRRDGVLRQLVDLQYSRNDQALSRAKFRVRGDTLELQPAYDDYIVRVGFFGDEVERITELDPLTGEVLAERNELNVYPASHFVTPAEKLKAAIVDIEAEMEQRVGELDQKGMVLEAERLRQRTTFDLEMMRELGFCSGIENYSRHLSRREPGSRPWTLLDYFPPDWLLVVDESHMTIPQVNGMYKNDRTRKEILVEFGFRLPSALDNRPLTFEEFEGHLDQVIHMSATPGAWELRQAGQVVEQLIRPTGIVDPLIEVRPTDGQIDDLLDRIRERIDRHERVLVTTLTKRLAEDLADYLHEMGVKVSYLHSEVDTLERVQILRDLRMGIYDVLVGINLLREGIDLPEVTLVAILDADKEGFLRSAWSLIQVIGRAARNTGGEVVMYADVTTESMKVAIEETNRRRRIQEAYNREHGVTPTTIVKEIRDINDRLRAVAEAPGAYGAGRELSEMSQQQVEKLLSQLEAEMRSAAKQLEFERAAALRDEISDIRLRVLEQDASVAVLKAAERAAATPSSDGQSSSTRPTAKPSERAAARKAGDRRGRASRQESALEVVAVTVLPADAEPSEGIESGTASDVFPGIRDAHEDDDEGWMARWLDRPTWDRRVTPNVIKRTGARARDGADATSEQGDRMADGSTRGVTRGEALTRHDPLLDVPPGPAPKDMAWIPGGTFRMGSDAWYPEERPVRSVTVDGFWMDAHPVTVAQFRRFVKATGYVTRAEKELDPALFPGADPSALVPGALVFRRTRGPVDLRDVRNWWAYVPGARWDAPEGPGSTTAGRERHPVTQVAYEDAEAYAAWAGKVLPSEAEWERAARGGLDQATYTWGDEFAPKDRMMANTWQGEFPWQNLMLDRYEGTSPVKSFPPNGYGLFDMAGNVWEWTSDFFRSGQAGQTAHACCAPRNPRVTEPELVGELPSAIPRRVTKGGSHLCAPNYCHRYRPAARQAEDVDTSTAHIGFRCIVRAASPDRPDQGTAAGPTAAGS